MQFNLNIDVTIHPSQVGTLLSTSGRLQEVITLCSKLLTF